MDHTSPIVTKDDEDKQNSEGCGWESEEVDGHQVLDMIVEKAPPGLGRWFATANHVLGNSGLGNGDAELRELAVNARRSPERIGSNIPGSARVLPERRLVDRADVSGSSKSIASEPRAVPPDNGLRLHDDEDVVPVRLDSSQKNPEAAVDIREARPFHRALEDDELLPECEILEGQRAARFERRNEGAKERGNHARMLTRSSVKDQEGRARTNKWKAQAVTPHQ